MGRRRKRNTCRSVHCHSQVKCAAHSAAVTCRSLRSHALFKQAHGARRVVAVVVLVVLKYEVARLLPGLRSRCTHIVCGLRMTTCAAVGSACSEAALQFQGAAAAQTSCTSLRGSWNFSCGGGLPLLLSPAAAAQRFCRLPAAGPTPRLKRHAPASLAVVGCECSPAQCCCSGRLPSMVQQLCIRLDCRGCWCQRSRLQRAGSQEDRCAEMRAA